jgi:hypothetical protein
MSATGTTCSMNFVPQGSSGQEEKLIEQLSSISVNQDDPRFDLANRLMAVSFIYKMADCCSQRSLEHIAANPNTPVGMLRQLADHPTEEVRVAVAENPSTTKDILLHLAHDSQADVRYSMAENANLPEEILKTLSEDDNPFVSTRAIKSMARQRSSRFTAQTARLNVLVSRTINSERGLKRFFTTLTNLARIGTEQAY